MLLRRLSISHGSIGADEKANNGTNNNMANMTACICTNIYVNVHNKLISKICAQKK